MEWVHGILQARILEWVAFPFSRGSSQPSDQTQVSHIAGEFFPSWATREALTPRQTEIGQFPEDPSKFLEGFHAPHPPAFGLLFNLEG